MAHERWLALITLPPDVKAEIERLERVRPDPAIDPEGCREINDEITRKINLARQWQAYGKQARKII